MNEQPALRRATVGDVEAITALVDAAYRDYAPLIGRTPIPMLTDYAVAVREHDVWVLEEAQSIVGVIELIAEPDHVWVENVAISPGAQHGGLGRRLLAFAESEARGRDVREVRLLTNELYQRNLALYGRLGYVETRRVPHLGTDLVHMAKALD